VTLSIAAPESRSRPVTFFVGRGRRTTSTRQWSFATYSNRTCATTSVANCGRRSTRTRQQRESRVTQWTRNREGGRSRWLGRNVGVR